MKFFLYQMQSTDKAPNGGDFRSWLHFYKWGRPETVTFRKTTPHFEGAHQGDVIFFVLDGFLIGDALINKVHNDVWVEGAAGPIQEIDIAKGEIWEYDRTWGLKDKIVDVIRLHGLTDEVPQYKGLRWLQQYRQPWTWEGVFPPLKGQVAVYKEGVVPPFFGIKKK